MCSTSAGGAGTAAAAAAAAGGGGGGGGGMYSFLKDFIRHMGHRMNWLLEYARICNKHVLWNACLHLRNS
jgi:hypothetical protein